MGTTTDKLNKLIETKADIKQSIIEKGVSVPTDATFASYPGYIDQISTGITPTGNIELQQQTGTNVTNYATASVKSGSATTPATTKQQSAPTFSQSGNKVTASVAATYTDVTPSVSAGWVSAGTSGRITMSANSATYTIPSGSAATPATTKQQSQPSISVNSSGLITASVAATSVSVTPSVTAGYVSSGTAGTITMSANSNTQQLSTQAAATITPSASVQTAVAAGKYTTGAVTVAACNIIRTGSGNPSSSLGNNGDIYIDIS